MSAYFHDVSVTTDADGDASVATPVLEGRLVSIAYVKTDFADGVDFTITTTDTSQTIWNENDVNASKTIAPRQPTHDNTGTASLYASTGEPVEDYYRICNETVTIVIASGGATKTGTFRLIIERTSK